MKIRRILFFVSALLLVNGTAVEAGSVKKQKKEAAKMEIKEDVLALDVDKQLQYCHKQVARALAELKQKDGIAVRRHLRSGVMVSGRESSGWTIRIPGMRLFVRLPKDIRNH